MTDHRLTGNPAGDSPAETARAEPSPGATGSVRVQSDAHAAMRDDPALLEPVGLPAPLGQRLRRLGRSRALRWLLGLTLTVVLIVVTASVFLGTVGAQQADDPRSNQLGGTAALGALLTAEGLRVSTTDRVSDAVDRASAQSTVVVANADRHSGLC